MQAKKSLGQNFLNQGESIERIARCVDTYFVDGEYILEIGPGRGALTRELLMNKKRVIAVEADGELILYLATVFKKQCVSGNLTLVHADILVYDETTIRDQSDRYHIVANIPYYITGAIVRKFLSSNFPPISMTLVMQEEVVDRILMRDGKTSILALSVWVYGTPVYQMRIPRDCFSPMPRVDSAVITVHSISHASFADRAHEELFFALVHAGFAHKRKYVIHNLKLYDRVYGWETALAKYNYSPRVRAEDIIVDHWISLVRDYRNSRLNNT